MFGVSISFYTNSSRFIEDAIFPLVLHGILISCLIPTLLASSFTREFEQQSLDMLRMTLITPRELVRGKFIAAFRLSILLSLISFVANFPFILDALLNNKYVALLIAGHVSLLVCALLAGSLALFASAITKRTATAVVTSFCFVLIAYFGVFFLLLLARMSTRGGMSNDTFEFLATITSPVMGYYASLMNMGGSYEIEFTWIVNIVEFSVVTLIVYFVSQSFYRRYRVRER